MDLNLLKAITDDKNRGSYATRWEAVRTVERVLALLYETPQSNALWKPLYEAIVVSYGLVAEWVSDEPSGED